MALTLNGDGSVGPLSSTEIGYLDGVTSAVQTQINTKAPSDSPAFTGNFSVSNSYGSLSIPFATYSIAGIQGYAVSGKSGFILNAQGASGVTAKPLEFLNYAGSPVGSVTTNNSATTYSTSSDYRLKENVRSIPNPIDRLNDLKPVRFNFIIDPDDDVDGFIAHEVQAVVPAAVTGVMDAVNDDGDPVYQGIDQSKLVPLLVAAVQELVAKVEKLESKIITLESA